MKRFALLIAILLSCRDNEIDRSKLHGIPEGVELHCSEFSDGAASCIGTDDKTYACVRDGATGCTTDRYDCAESSVFTRTKHTTTYVHSSAPAQ